MNRLNRKFFSRDVLEVAPDLLGKSIVLGTNLSSRITEVEAYRGEEDLACHARFGRTKRTEALYGEAGTIYVYLIYGMYWLINIVTGQVNQPQAVLIRSVQGITGPGRVGRWLGLDKSFYGEDITTSSRIWIETSDFKLSTLDFITTPRVGIDYAGEWAQKPWRFVLRSGHPQTK